MDADHFDTLTLALTEARSRRGTLAALLGGTSGLLGLADTVARQGNGVHGEGKKKKKKRKRKKRPTCPEGQRPCKGACLSALICCDDGDCAGGRTCQTGTCGCPSAKPHVCLGGTICQQCCVKADCAAHPELNGVAIPECSADHVCVCAQAGTRYCPDRQRCGACCDSAECTGGRDCITYFDETVALTCLCAVGNVLCAAAGRTGCIPGIPACYNSCNTDCNPQDETPCPCDPFLVCDFDPANQEDGYHCAPR